MSTTNTHTVADLEPRIRAILTAPEIDLDVVTRKQIIKQLAEQDPTLTADWIADNKKEIKKLTDAIFVDISGDGEGPSALPPSSPEKGPSTPATARVNGKLDREAGPSTPVPTSKPPTIKKSKDEVSDEQLARQLQAQMNGQRASRSGKAGQDKHTKSNGKKRKMKSAAIIDSDGSAVEDSDCTTATASKKRKTKKSNEEGGKPGGAFNKEFALSAALSAVVGAERLSRPQVVKQLWVYIKEHELQNPNDKRQILNDSALKDVFGVDKMTMFNMNSLLTS